jgi:hypothetical protein
MNKSPLIVSAILGTIEYSMVATPVCAHYGIGRIRTFEMLDVNLFLGLSILCPLLAIIGWRLVPEIWRPVGSLPRLVWFILVVVPALIVITWLAWELGPLFRLPILPGCVLRPPPDPPWHLFTGRLPLHVYAGIYPLMIAVTFIAFRGIPKAQEPLGLLSRIGRGMLGILPPTIFFMVCLLLFR